MEFPNKVQLITYANSLGKNLEELHAVLAGALAGLFDGGVHILPPFPSSGDRGFAPIDYFQIEKEFGGWQDIATIGERYPVILDLMVNHISRQSPYFQDYLRNGKQSPYRDLFLTLDKVWADGIPVQDDIDKIFLRRKVPYSKYTTRSGEEITLWTSFGKTDPSEQIDVDVHSEAAKELFRNILHNFSNHGVKIVRLDAVGYIIKKPGTSCFFVEPEIYDFLDWIATAAKELNLLLLPEVHSHYSIQQKLAERGFWIYDFILPYRILEALVENDFSALASYLEERPKNQFTMLDCHDGVPVIPDLNGLVDVKQACKIVELCRQRGSNFSRVSGSHKMDDGFDIHQIRGTIYSILNENDDDYIQARALQFFAPGIPQVYYVGLLAGVNHPECAEATGDGREINRYNYSVAEIEGELGRDVVQRLIRLIRFRNTHPSFDGEFSLERAEGGDLALCWRKDEDLCRLTIHRATGEAYIDHTSPQGMERYWI